MFQAYSVQASIEFQVSFILLRVPRPFLVVVLLVQVMIQREE